MGLIDLNACTARQLTEYAGIGKSLADSIIRYRRCFGGYKHIDELWKITGISRASYRNLQQYFYVGGQIVPAMGERLPNAKVAITESMLQVLTNEHVAEQRAVKRTSGPAAPKKTTDSGPSGFTRTAKSANKGKTKEWQLPTSDIVERAKSSPNANNEFKSEDILSAEVTLCEAAIGDAALEVEGKIISSVPADNKCSSPRGKYPKKAWDSSRGPKEKVAEPGITAAGAIPEEGPVGPSVVLRASSSGNNINVSCTFDKNLLISEKPVALKFNANKKKEKLDEAIEEAIEGKKGENTKNQTEGAKKTTTAATKNNKLAEAGSAKSGQNKSDIVEAKAKSTKKREYEHETSTRDKDTLTFVAELNKDNLEYFTAEKRYGATKQRKMIEAWIEDVNEHISGGTLACTGDNVLSEIDKGQGQKYVASGPTIKVQPATDRKTGTQNGASWQIKTKNITFGDRPSTSGQGKILESSCTNGNISSVSTYNVNGIWSKLRDMASAPFKGLYDNRLDDLPPPTAPAKAKQKKVSPQYVRPVHRVHHDETTLPGKRRHNEKRIPPLHQENRHQGATYPSSSSSGRLPRKSAKPSIYMPENLSHYSGGTWTKSRNGQPMSPSCRRWAEDNHSRSFRYSSPSPMLSEKNASKSWRDMQIQLLQKRLKQMKNNSSHPSPRRKTAQKYALSSEKPNRGHKFV